jgi:hypothetical protein
MSNFDSVTNDELLAVDGGAIPWVKIAKFVGETLAAWGIGEVAGEVFKPIDFKALQQHYQK